MINYRNTFQGVLAAAAFMVPAYVILYFIDILILGGDYDPLGLFFLPIAACGYSAIAFWLYIFPAAHLIRLIGNARGMHRTSAAIATAVVCGAGGALLGVLSGGLTVSLLFCAYFAGSGLLFFDFAATASKAELSHPPSFRT